jgi:ADP-heptose:LPS heptosyltransferase
LLKAFVEICVKLDYKNILVIQTAFIGDAILASSLLEKLHSKFPQAALSIVVRKGNEGIYKDHPFLKEVLIWDKTTAKTSNLVKLLFKIRGEKYDCVINCHRFASSGFLTGFSGARHKAGYKQTPFSYLFDTTVKHTIGDGKHEVERYDQLIRDFTDDKVFKPKLYPSKENLEKIKAFQTSKYLCMAPASVWFTKQLPVEKWIELCKMVPSDTTIYLLGASSDVALCNSIREKSGSTNVTVLAGQLNLLDSCALMQNAQMNYVNDSAPLHLASSVNAPVTAFFCSTVPNFGFGPLSEHSKIMEVQNLYCRPCGLHGYKTCPEGHFKCGKEIDLKQLPL